MLDNYEINKSTLAIIPVESNISKIYEHDSNFIINKSVADIINHSCKYFGSSYVGRYEGAKNILGVSYKLPIIIEETQELIFFPTNSPRLDNCSWISLKNINNYIKNDNQMFLNGCIQNHLDYTLIDDDYESAISPLMHIL